MNPLEGQNPFEDTFEQIGPCWANSDCPYLPQHFLRFANAPATLPVKQVQGSVVVVGGSSGHGKTVYGHRLLHDYKEQGFQPVDLLGVGPFRQSLARRQEVLVNLRNTVGALNVDDVAESQVDDALWAGRLRNAMGMAGGGLVVRLPCMMRDASDGDARIAWEIFQYGMAAQQSKSVFIYEFNAKTWPDDWDALCAELDQNLDVTVRKRVLEPVTPADLWAYVKAVMDKSPRKRIALEAEIPDLLRYVFECGRLHPRSVHDLMRRVFDNAIGDQSASVALRHLMPEIIEIGSRAA